MAAQPVGSETVLELFNAVFTLSAIVVELKDRMAAALQVGHQEAQVGAGGGVFGLIADAALTKPALGTVTETGKRALGLPGATIAASEPALETSGAALERSEEHTSELQSRLHLVCRLLLEKKKKKKRDKK